LDGTNYAFLEVGAVLLHDDNRFLESVLFVHLFLELACYSCVGYISEDWE